MTCVNVGSWLDVPLFLLLSYFSSVDAPVLMPLSCCSSLSTCSSLDDRTSSWLARASVSYVVDWFVDCGSLRDILTGKESQ